MRREGYFWGLFLILLGGIMLFKNLGWLPPQVNVWGLFWPLVLIALGIRALLPVFAPQSVRSESLVIPLETMTSVRLKVRHGAGELRVQAGAQAGYLLEGSFEGGVVHEISRSGDSAAVELRLPTANFDWVGSSHGLLWTLSLSPEIIIALDMEVGASRNILDLRNLRVTELRLSTGASASDIEMPANAGETRAWIRSGAASVNLCIPIGVAARINARGGLAGIKVDSLRFPRVGGVYQSLDFASAENRLDLDIETGVGSISVT